jgi:hypothetical protein
MQLWIVGRFSDAKKNAALPYKGNIYFPIVYEGLLGCPLLG